MSFFERLTSLFSKSTTESNTDKDKDAKKDEGVEIVHEPAEQGDPKDLKGLKLADCTFQAPCTGLT